jgi:hypothetical protein
MVKFGRSILHRYANEDVSLGSWLIGMEVEHVDDRSMCCGTPHLLVLDDKIYSGKESSNHAENPHCFPLQNFP